MTTATARTAAIEPLACQRASPIGVVMAGGRSLRMGQDKATLQLAGQSLLQRAQDTLRAAGCQRVLLSGAARPAWDGENIADLVSAAGPAGAIVSVLTHLVSALPAPDAVAGRTPAPTAAPLCVLFIPVDAPLLSPALLQTLLDQASNGDGCTIAQSPLPLVLRTTPAVLAQCISTLPALRAGASCSIRQFLHPLQRVCIAPNAAITACLSNINTPTEWENLRREFKNCP